jgi:hypothetical protein
MNFHFVDIFCKLDSFIQPHASPIHYGTCQLGIKWKNEIQFQQLQVVQNSSNCCLGITQPQTQPCYSMMYGCIMVYTVVEMCMCIFQCFCIHYCANFRLTCDHLLASFYQTSHPCLHPVRERKRKI